MNCKDFRFSGHAIRRMFDRQVSPADVRAVIDDSEIVRDYPDDQPLPSRLLLGQAGGRALHVVGAFEVQTGMCKVDRLSSEPTAVASGLQDKTP